ncbi:MAG: imidazolonepropionase [Myxococcales bacterium]|nr:imidazolonepropionase [Myxococcales bacterium]
MSRITQTIPRKRLTNIHRLYPMDTTIDAVRSIADAEIILEGESIIWAGPREQAPSMTEGEQLFDMEGAICTPGWIDAHTHLVWAGSRQGEFRARLEGKSYLDIAKAGGGIMSTVREVRNAQLDELIDGGRQRLQRMLSFGVTTVEAKSGYGLSTEAELKLLRAIAALQQEGPIELSPTFLGAHTIPTEHKPNRSVYLDLVCEEMLPQVAEEGLAEACDVFVEEGAFSIEEGRRVLQKGLDLGLKPRIHADQLSAGGGAELAAELGALSADHLEEISPTGIQRMAEAGVVACLIPGSTFCLRQQRYAPARAMIDAGLQIALATDLNPGTTNSESLPFLGTLACLQMGLLPEEVLYAVTVGAAHAVQRADRIGRIATGYQADLAFFAAPDVDYLFYHYAVPHTSAVYKRGQLVWEQPKSSLPQ